jgi:hypothetical protein
MIRNLMLYPAELRGLRSFPRVSAHAPQGLSGTKRDQAAHAGTLAAQFRAHGAGKEAVICGPAEVLRIHDAFPENLVERPQWLSVPLENQSTTGDVK